jgi:phosphoribosylglycinamide formyltransferase 1
MAATPIAMLLTPRWPRPSTGSTTLASQPWWCWPGSCVSFVARYAGRLLNIHPSLLPAFPGLHTHQKALQAGCRFAGATVHQVTADLDQGSILAQALVPILPGDDPQQLAARVLTQEHLIYPRAIAAWLENQGAEA